MAEPTTFRLDPESEMILNLLKSNNQTIKQRHFFDNALVWRLFDASDDKIRTDPKPAVVS